MPHISILRNQPDVVSLFFRSTDDFGLEVRQTMVQTEGELCTGKLFYIPCYRRNLIDVVTFHCVGPLVHSGTRQSLVAQFIVRRLQVAHLKDLLHLVSICLVINYRYLVNAAIYRTMLPSRLYDAVFTTKLSLLVLYNLDSSGIKSRPLWSFLI